MLNSTIFNKITQVCIKITYLKDKRFHSTKKVYISLKCAISNSDANSQAPPKGTDLSWLGQPGSPQPLLPRPTESETQGGSGEEA